MQIDLMKCFKYISKVMGWMACIALLLQVVGCNRGLDDLAGGEGTLSLSIEYDDQVTVKSENQTKSDIPDDLTYSLDIENHEGEIVSTIPDHTNAGTIQLKKGVYTVNAKDNIQATGLFGKPAFTGSAPVTIVGGENTPVVMTCSLSNVKVEVVAFNIEKELFEDYSLEIKQESSDEGTLTFREDDVTAGQQGWIAHNKDESFVVIFRATTKPNSPEATYKEVTYIQTIRNVEAADFYKLTVTMEDRDDDGDGGQSDGGAIFTLKVQHNFEETIDVNFTVIGERKAIPVATWDDEEKGPDINQPMVLIANDEDETYTRAGNFKVNIKAAEGIKRLRIMHRDPKVMLKYGLPGSITLGGGNSESEDKEQRDQVKHLVTWGDWGDDGTIVGKTEMFVDFSTLINEAKCDDLLLPGGKYEIELEMYDQQYQMVSQMITIVVARDLVTGATFDGKLVNAKGVTGEGVEYNTLGVGAKYAYMTAKWLGADQPTELGFEYRIAVAGQGADDNWTEEIVVGAEIDAPNKSFTKLLSNLTPNKDYEFRAIGRNAGVALTAGSIGVFKTDVVEEIENLNFDTWSKDKVWYPNANKENSYWATGNEGVSMAGESSNSVPVDEKDGKKAAKLTTIDVMIADIAAGNIYVGTYKTNITNPAASAVMGKPYTGRPIRLRGWYKYTPAVINVGEGEYAQYVDKGIKDHCSIYIRLENWGVATERPAASNIKVIAEAVLENDQDVLDYTQFDMQLEYKDAETYPTHVVLVASSSRYGEYFCGGIGSELFVDEFELVWEPSQQTNP